jgi:hypothetical protein
VWFIRLVDFSQHSLEVNGRTVLFNQNEKQCWLTFMLIYGYCFSRNFGIASPDESGSQ